MDYIFAKFPFLFCEVSILPFSVRNAKASESAGFKESLR